MFGIVRVLLEPNLPAISSHELEASTAIGTGHTGQLRPTGLHPSVSCLWSETVLNLVLNLLRPGNLICEVVPDHRRNRPHLSRTRKRPPWTTNVLPNHLPCRKIPFFASRIYVSSPKSRFTISERFLQNPFQSHVCHSFRQFGRLQSIQTGAQMDLRRAMMVLVSAKAMDAAMAGCSCRNKCRLVAKKKGTRML